MKIENKTAPIPIRLDSAMRHRISVAALKLGTSQSSIIRMGMLIILKQVDAGYISFNITPSDKPPSILSSGDLKSSPLSQKRTEVVFEKTGTEYQKRTECAFDKSLSASIKCKQRDRSKKGAC